MAPFVRTLIVLSIIALFVVQIDQIEGREALVSSDEYTRLDAGLAQAESTHASVLGVSQDTARLIAKQQNWTQTTTSIPDYPMGFVYRGAIEFQLGQFDAARLSLDRALTLDPYNDTAKRIIQMINLMQNIEEVQ